MTKSSHTEATREISNPAPAVVQATGPSRERRQFNRTRPGSRRRGMAIVWAALTLTAFLGVAALTVDQGFHLSRRAEAQRAADAAALAGGYIMATEGSSSLATTRAIDYAVRNRYNPYATSNAATVSVTYPAGRPTYSGTGPTPTPYPDNWFKVHVERAEPMFFGGAFIKLVSGGTKTRQIVGATSIAEFFPALAPMDINGGGTYGLNNGPASLSMFGPDGLHGNGDYRSVKLLNNGQPNPDYNADKANDKDESNGYNFNVNIPTNYTSTEVDIFDPDTYNKDNIADALTGVRMDELRTPSGGSGTAANATTTRYRLYADNNTPTDLSDDTLVILSSGSYAEVSYGNDSSTDMKWNTVFKFNRQNYGSQNFRMNATTMSGSSENGFNIRAGKPTDDDGLYNSQGVLRNPPGTNTYATNGTSITAQGSMPMNFNKGGTQTITLGYVPAEAKGRYLTVRKFDTDVGSTSVIYTCDTLPGFSYTGVLAGADAFATDKIPIPANYTGGNWKATYSAGIQDTSVWDMSYFSGLGTPGKVHLVQ